MGVEVVKDEIGARPRVFHLRTCHRFLALWLITDHYTCPPALREPLRNRGILQDGS